MPDTIKEALWQMELQAKKNDEMAEYFHKARLLYSEQNHRHAAKAFRESQMILRKQFGVE